MGLGAIFCDRDCGEMVTQDAIAKQYHYETGEDLYAEKEIPWEK